MAYRHATIADLPPEFDSFDSRDLQYWLGVAKAEVGLDAFGSDASNAHAMLAAHLLKRAPRSDGTAGSMGTVTKEKVDDVEVTYGNAPTVTELQTTMYGRRFLALRQGVFVGGVLTL